MTFNTTSVKVTCATLSKDYCVQPPWKYIKACGYSDSFFKKKNNHYQRSMTPKWPLTQLLLRSNVWLNPRITVSKSHGNTSMYVDKVIIFAKNITYYKHTDRTYIYILRIEWVITHSLSDRSFWSKSLTEQTSNETKIEPTPQQWLSSNLLWFASLNNKAFGNIFCNPQKSFHTSPESFDLKNRGCQPFFKLNNSIYWKNKASCKIFCLYYSSRGGVKTLLWITK